MEISDYQLEKMAFEVGFMKRQSKKIDASKMLDIICLTSTNGTPSYNDLASRLYALSEVSASKQAFCKRVNDECVLFFKYVLEKTIEKKYNHIDIESLKNSNKYKRVIVQDSTIIRLPLRLFPIFSGVANASTSVCNARVQCVYELLTGSFLEFSIDPYTKNDLTAAPELEIKEGDLVLRDRGYNTYQEIQRHINAKADCIYRHNFNSTYLDPDTLEAIDLKKLLKSKQKLDMEVCLNNKNKTKVRLIAESVPEKVANERRRKAKIQMHGHNPAKELLFLMSWSIFITTIPQEKADFKKIMNIYRLRWKIEIIFKIMKSHMSFAKIHNVSFNQLQVLLIARFIVLVLSVHLVYQPYYPIVEKHSNKQLSLGKFINYIIQNPECFVKILTQISGLQKNDKEIIKQLVKYCCYDKRKRLNINQQLDLLRLS